MVLRPLKLQRWEIVNKDVYYQETYPNNYEGVLYGSAYWYPPPIKILEYSGRFAVLDEYIPPEIEYGGTWMYHYIDLDHPRCPSCGKFVKKGNWWKGIYSGPCANCYEYIFNV